MRQLLSVIFATFVGLVSAQRPFDPILELQVTTGMNGVVIATAPDITVATLSGLYFHGDTLYNTVTNTDAQTFAATGTTNPSLLLAGGTGGGGTVQLVGAGINTISNSANVITITGTEVDGSLTNEAQTLTIAGTTSPTISLNAISGVGGGTATFASGSGITLSQSGGTITVTNSSLNTDAQTLSFSSPNLSISGGNSVSLSALLDSKWTDAGAYTYLTATGDNAVVGASTQPSSAYKLQVSGGLYASGNFQFNGAMSVNGFEGSTIQILKGNGAGNPPVWFTPSNIAAATTEIDVTGGTNQVVGASNVTLKLAQQSATSGQVLKWNGTQWAPGTDNNTGTITGANNGLSLSGGNVQLGGALIQATTIDQDGFLFYTKDGKAVHGRYNNNSANTQSAFEVEGLAATVNNTGTPSEDGVFTVKAYNNAGGVQYGNALTFGIYTTATDGAWLASRNQSTPSTLYPLHINPNGGKFIYGTNTVPDAAASFYGKGLSSDGTSLASVTLHVASTGETSTYPKISLGVNNTRQAQIWYNGTDVATRVNSMVSGSTFRISVGTNENDDKVIVMGNGTGRLGAGFSSTTGLHSTLQSSGSFAARMLETAGAPTFDETKYTVVYTSTTNQTFTLPSASTVTGRVYWINHAGSAGTITFSSSISVGNGVTFNTLAPGEWCRIVAGAASWRGKKW